MLPSIPFDQECSDIWENKMRQNPSIQGMSMRYDVATAKFVLDRIFDTSFDFKEFTTDPTLLPKNDGRLIVYYVPSSFPGSKRSKLVMFKWTPLQLPSKVKFMFPVAIACIKNMWSVNKDIDANDVSAFDYETVCKDLKLDKE